MLFSAEHIVLSAISVFFIIRFFYLQMMNCNYSYSKNILKHASVIMLILEILRISWTTYYYGFSLKNIRFDWCNQVCLALPLIVLSGNKKLFPYIDILAFIGGTGVIIYPIWVFYDYAGLHFMSMQRMISHTLMVIISISMCFISNHWEKERNIKKPLIGFELIAVIAFIMSKLLNINYLLMMNADGIPLLKNFPFPWYFLIAIPCLVLVINITKLMFQEINNKIADRHISIMLEYDNKSFKGLVEEEKIEITQQLGIE